MCSIELMLHVADTDYTDHTTMLHALWDADLERQHSWNVM